MFSAKSVKILALLPFQLLYVTLQYFALGLISQFRRYRKNLLASMKMVAARAIMEWNILEGALFNKMSVGAVLQDLAVSNLAIVQNIPNFGKRYLEKAYWLVEQPDRTPEDLVLIYCHGGAYFLQLSMPQAESLLAIYCLLSKEKRKRVSILVLDYRLACHGYTFPCQMDDLHQLYYSVKKTSSRIGLMGDSAGGNLAIGFTQYLKLQNAPPEDYPLLLALISPWLNIFPDADTLHKDSSYMTNGDGDIVPFHSFVDASKRELILGKEDRYSLIWSPATKVPPTSDDWTSLPTYNDPRRKIFLLTGEDETLRDDSIYWANYALGAQWNARNYKKTRTDYSVEELQHKTPNVEAYIEPYGVHDAIMVFEKGLVAVNEGKSLGDLDDETCYGTRRLVDFLDRAI